MNQNYPAIFLALFVVHLILETDVLQLEWIFEDIFS